MKNCSNILIFFILLLFIGCNNKNEYRKTEGLIWNTTYHIIYQSDKNLEDSIMIIMDRVNSSLSFFNENSIVSKVNRNKDTEVDSLFITVYNKSKEIFKKSNENFDPTVSPVISAWGFGKGHEATGDTTSIDSLLQFVGLNKTYLEGNILHKQDVRTQFNFSAIAKGFGCDLVGEMFKRNGVVNYMVEIGGELVLSGISPSEGNWKISIDAPVYSANNINHESSIIISLTDCGIATSGNYRNYQEIQGNRFGHTISPKTGRPIQTDILSATVIAKNCMEADAIATACMVSGSVEGMKLINELDVEALFILPDTIIYSPGFKKFIIEAF